MVYNFNYMKILVHFSIAANIHEALSEPLIAAQKSLEDTLEEYTLFGVVEKIKKYL